MTAAPLTVVKNMSSDDSKIVLCFLSADLTLIVLCFLSADLTLIASGCKELAQQPRKP